MTMHPITRFLGVAPDASPEQLLGLAAGERRAALIEEALRARLAKVYDHPDGRSTEAELVRRRLREVAQTLRAAADAGPAVSDARTGNAAPRPTPRAAGAAGMRAGASAASSTQSTSPARPAPTLHPPRRTPGIILTPFDRTVMAILIASGGWNAQSRSKLVALAAEHGVTAQGLIRVMTGLSEHVKGGGGRVGLDDILTPATGNGGGNGSGRGGGSAAACGTGRFAPTPGVSLIAGSPTIDAVERLGTAVQNRLREGFERDTLSWRVAVSFVFGLVTIAACAAGLWMLLPQAEPPAADSIAADPAAVPADASGGASAPLPDAGAGADVNGEQGPALPGPLRLAYSTMPTFSAEPRPVELVAAADRLVQIKLDLDEVGRKLEVAEDEPSEAVYRLWETALRDAGMGWLLWDDATRRDVERAVLNALYVGGSAPSVSAELLEALVPSAPGASNDPLDVPRGPWQAGMLARIAGNDLLPPAVVEQARAQLDRAVDETLSARDTNFDTAAARWLARQGGAQVERVAIDPNASQWWELWLGSLRALEGRPETDAAVVDAIHALLATPHDLTRAGPAADLLGRLVSEVDWTSSRAARDALPAMFESDEVTSDDLWVFTTLLTLHRRTPWFERTFIVAPEADEIDPLIRRRRLGQILSAWPESPMTTAQAAEGSAVAVDADTATRWEQLFRLMQAQPLMHSPSGYMEQLLAAARLNEAAARLATGQVGRAQEALDAVEAVVTSAEFPDDGAGAAPEAVGHPVGPDGQWAQAYEAAGRSTEERTKWLNVLRRNESTDLAEPDAIAFVREVYRASPEEVRRLAQAVVVEKFTRGPTVALMMLDHLPIAPRTVAVSSTIAEFTGRVLPPVQSAAWPVEARLALAAHARSLRTSSNDAVDDRHDELLDVLLERLAILHNEPYRSANASDAQDAMQRLVDAWRARAHVYVVTTPVPDDLAGLQRRDGTRQRLAEGPIQHFVAGQLAVLDLLAYITVAEQPRLASAIERLLREATVQRSEVDHVLEQAVLAEQAIAAVWRLRIAADQLEPQAEENAP